MLARALLLVLALLGAACSASKARSVLSKPQLPQCEAGYVLTSCNGQWTCLPPGADQNVCAQPFRR